MAKNQAKTQPKKDEAPKGPDFASFTEAVDATPLPTAHLQTTNLFHDLVASVEAIQPEGKHQQEALKFLFAAKQHLHAHFESHKIPTKQ